MTLSDTSRPNYRIARRSSTPALATSRKLSQSWIVTPVNHSARDVAGAFLDLLLRLLRRGDLFNTAHGIRPLLTKAFEIKLPNEFSERQLPRLLVMVVQLPKLLWIHPKFTSHLYVRLRQVKLASRLDPRL